MPKVKVSVSDRQAEIKVPAGMRLLIRRCCHAVLVMEGFAKPAEVSVSFISDIDMAALNDEFRGIAKTTDVLSFPLGVNGVYDKNAETGAYMLGDIVISLPRAVEQARNYGHSLRREIGFLTVHSMLHLLGYDHEDGGMQALTMREKEEAALAGLGLSRDLTLIAGEE